MCFPGGKALKRIDTPPYDCSQRPASLSSPAPRRQHLAYAGGLIVAGGLLALGGAALRADTPRPAKTGQTAATSAASRPAQLAYDFKPGATYHYKVTGFFTGHFPPFSQPGSPPINLKAQLEYSATVKKRDDKGAEVDFVVDAADVSLLEKEPGPDGKIDPNSEIPFPLPLAQVQQTLNVTAVLRPDGSVASVQGGNAPPVRIDLGLDLRKLFLLIMPVTFPDRPLHVNDSWNFQDGVLGNKPGKVSYTAHLLDVRPTARNLAFRIGQNAEAAMDDNRPKEGKSTDNPSEAVEALNGKVTVSGDLLFVTPAVRTGNQGDKGAAANPDLRLGRVEKGQLVMSALLTRKRAAADPEHPEEPLESKIDVRARLFVQVEAGPGKPAGAISQTPSAPVVADKRKDKKNP